MNCGIFLRPISTRFAITALTVMGITSAQATPNLNSSRSNPRRTINEVLFEITPNQFLSVPSVDSAPVGLWIHGINFFRQNNTLHETVSMGNDFNSRGLLGSWTNSFGTFRFTRQPASGVAPNNRNAGFLAAVPSDVTQLEILARRTADLQAGLPSQTMAVFANGINVGSATPTSGNSPAAYRFPLNLQDRYQFFIVGAGSATLRNLAIYNSAQASTPLRTYNGLSLAIPAGGGVVTYNAPYAGPATDLYARVEATGTNSSSRLIIRSFAGRVILNVPLTNGIREFITEDTDDVRRQADARFALATDPNRATQRIIYSEGFHLPNIAWTPSPSYPASTLSQDGANLVLDTTTDRAGMVLRLPRTISFQNFPYLTMRIRVTPGFLYFVRPFVGGTAAFTNKFQSAMEQRRGTGAFETITFNVRSMQTSTEAPVTGADRFVIEVIPNPTMPPAPGTRPQIALDYLSINAGLVPAVLSSQETNFQNSLDDNGDFMVDRDDSGFRAQFPRQVLVNYQTIFQNNGIGFTGTKRPLPGNPGSSVFVDAAVLNPANNKRNIRSIFYPLDYIKHPNYVPPAYNELFDRSAQGIWSPCGAANTPPTNQFPSLNYDDLGAIEEYNPRGTQWVQAQIQLTRRHGIDGWIYNDNGNDREVNADFCLPTVAERLQANRNAFSYPPFRISSFFVNLPSLSADLNDAVSQLSYIALKRQKQLPGYLTFQGRPLAFIYPSRVGPSGPLRFSLDQWNSTIFPALRNPTAANFDGAISAPTAQPSTLNTLVMNFDRTRNDLPGGPLAGAIASIEFFDRDLQPTGNQLIFGTPETRANNLLEGFGSDIPVGATEFTSTNIQRTDGGTPGFARAQIYIPSTAAVMTMRLFAFGNSSAVGGVQQNLALRFNTNDGPASITFPAREGWSTYNFRFRDLPAGFTEHNRISSPAPNMALSLFGDIRELVRTSNNNNNSSGFAGFASYVNSFFDGRTEVSYPFIQAATLTPGFDQSGFLFACTNPDNSFESREGGANYRRKWERAILGDADMAIITTMNEWAEGTNIEPDIEHGFLYMRLTLTYSLIYREIMETGKLPSVTNLLTTQFDPDGRNRTIAFSLTGPDTIRLSKIPWGAGGSGVTITRNGIPVSIGGAEASFSGSGPRPVLRINAPSGQSSYRITYNSGDGRFGCFIDRLYRDILKRDPDQGGFDFYVTALTGNTISIQQTAANFIYSSEFRNRIGFIARCYFGIFNNNSTSNFTSPGYRIPDRGGMLFWADVMSSRGSIAAGQEAVVTGFTMSNEWTTRVGNRDNSGFVDFLYENILGRNPDPTGKAFHVNNLNNGTSTRTGLILAFLNSPEAVNRYQNMSFAVMAYLGLLDRSAERSGFIFHTERLNSGVSPVSFLNGFLLSNEYVNRLSGLSCQHPSF
jgi:hypothetical protein